jgi:hypothetical protein
LFATGMRYGERSGWPTRGYHDSTGAGAASFRA